MDERKGIKMAQGPNDTLCSWGTYDANAQLWVARMVAMVNEIAGHGWSGPKDIMARYGYTPDDWGVKAKIRTADGKNFIG